MSMAVDIAEFAAANGFGSTASPGPTIMANIMSAKPDNVISFYDSSGFEPIRAMGHVAQEVRNLQAIVRNADPLAAESIARALWKFLDMKANILINGTMYFAILARSSPFSLGADENNRQKWSCNYKVHKAVTA